MLQIKSLASATFGQLYDAFSAAFADYEVQQIADQLRSLLKRRGFVPELSFGGFEDDKLVSFTFNGIGIYAGQKMAYDTGTGTLKEYRGKGLAGEIFKHALPYLREAGIEKYLLEVLKNNTSAISVYRKQGFEITREFSCFTASRKSIALNNRIKVKGIRTDSSNLSQVSQFRSWMDFYPSWQNTFESVERLPNAFIIKAAYINDLPAGYCIFEPSTGDITQIAVDPFQRRKGVATSLLAEVLKECLCDNVKLVNADNSFPALSQWAISTGLEKRVEQFEMIRKL